MKRLAVSNLSIFGFGLAVLTLLIVIVFAASNLCALIESNYLVRHTLIVLSTLETTLALFTDAETGKRATSSPGTNSTLNLITLPSRLMAVSASIFKNFGNSLAAIPINSGGWTR